MMKKLVTVAAVVSWLVVSVAPAWANHRHPPRAILKAPGAWQRGTLGTHCWSYVDKGSDEGVGFCADAFGHDFPEPDRSEVGARAKIRLWARTPPSEYSVDQWRSVDQKGQPIGQPERLSVTLRPHRRDGVIVAYDLRFTLPATPGDVYLTAFVQWDSIRYSDGRASGDAVYDFHVIVE